MKLYKILIAVILSLFVQANLMAQGAGTCQKPADPGSFVPDNLDCWKWVNTTSGDHFCYNGSAWVICQGTSGTDDQNIQGSGLSGTILTIGIEDGGSENVDLAPLQDGTGTDDQNISGSAFNPTTKVLTIGIEDGANEDVDLTALDEHFFIQSFVAQSNGAVRIIQEDESGGTVDHILEDVELLPAYDTKADADAALPVGRIWVASDNNNMGVNPGQKFITR